MEVAIYLDFFGLYASLPVPTRRHVHREQLANYLEFLHPLLQQIMNHSFGAQKIGPVTPDILPETVPDVPELHWWATLLLSLEQEIFLGHRQGFGGLAGHEFAVNSDLVRLGIDVDVRCDVVQDHVLFADGAGFRNRTVAPAQIG